MKIVTWNCNSLGARRSFVETYLDLERPDVLALQELKLETDKVPVDLFASRGYHVAVHGQKSWNGVLIASREPLRDVQIGLPSAEQGQSRVIAATTAGVRLVNLYCPQGQKADSDKFQYKLAFYDALIAWLAEILADPSPLIVLGDLNIAREAEDLWDPSRFEGVPSFHPLEIQRFERLERLGLRDLVKPYLEPGAFSFWDYRGAAFRFNQGMRIDYLLGNATAAERVRGGWIARDWRKKRDGLTPSDHAPVGVELGTSD